ncbi:MAG: hypothetical protein EOP47_22130 [Sphingobacteriaceae bacterium]|nr:MAG: hypothetical protein EOP47_22130 [Sphingobacteriaceae bacterium]
MDFDSLQISLSDNNKPIDTLVLRKNRKETFKKDVSLTFNIGSDGKLKPSTDLLIKANLPIESFNPALISLKEDSAIVNNFTLVKDTMARRLILKYRWKQNVSYTLTFEENALTNIFGDKNKKGIRTFTIDKPENYSILTLKVTVPELNKSYILELYKDEVNLQRSDVLTKNSTLVYNNYITGKYTIKVIYDTNKNGRWDSGNIRQKRQPENVWIYEKELTLRPNWDAEEAFAIPKEAATP